MSEDEQAQVLRPSRYRSLRKQTISTSTPPNAMRTAVGNHDPGQQQGNAAGSSTISRSMSRYRRRAASVTAGTDNHVAQTMQSGLENAPPVPAIPSSLHPAGTGSHHEHVIGSSSAAAQNQSRHTQTQRRARGQTTDKYDDQTRATYNGDCNGPAITSGRGRQNGSLAQRDVSWEEERDRLLEEQKRKDLQRLEEELESCRRAKAQSHKFIRSPVVEKFMALAKGNKTANHDGMPSSSPVSPMTTTASAGPSAVRRPDQEPARTLPAAAHIEPGGRGIVPQKDAPASASNAGGRNVVVRYRHHHTLSIHVTPETTAVDLMTQASSQAAHDVEIDPERCLVVEQYSLLGLERRLRRYERIRDVMNSWDSDAQNQLAIVWPDPNENHQDLLASAVVESDEPPSGCQLYMYHSSRPGKWNKRWITVLQTGQIVCAKKPNAKATDKDTASLCHLSDYDIYTPTESQMRRHIKPPKRFCFAIKSQHKTTLFLNTDNYVQYFCTEDPAAAHEFKQRAHGWRSWYLVDRHPDARKKNSNDNNNNSTSSSEIKAEYNDTMTTPASPPAHYATPKQSDNAAAADGQRSRVFVDESPYSIGQFEPLLDLTRFDTRLSQLGKEVPTPQSEPPSRQAADQKFRRRLSKREKPDSSRHPPVFAERESDDGFTGGLLGEEYDNRKQALADLDKKKRSPELAFTEGASLLKSQQDPEFAIEKQPESSSWFPSAQEHTATQRPNHQIGATTRPPVASGHGTGGRHYSLSAATHRPTGLGPSSAARSSSTHDASQHTSSRTQMQQLHPNPLQSQPTGLPYPDRHAVPKPLVDLTPTFQEPPQWSKEKKGHGVKPPEGLGHLVDFISAGTGTDSTSNRSILRRPTTSGSAPLGRTRSMSAATSSGRPLLDGIPPVPLLPSRLGPESDPNHSRRPADAPVAREGRVERRETVRHRGREQERVRHRSREQEQRDRQYREREAAYNAVPGRTGTLKVV